MKYALANISAKNISYTEIYFHAFDNKSLVNYSEIEDFYTKTQTGNKKGLFIYKAK